jgi:hypothetical protein
MKLWLSILLFVAAATAGGMVIRGTGYPAAIPQAIQWTLNGFVEPGLAIWWFTMGGAFQGGPTNGADYVITVIANIAIWLVIAVLAIGLARVLGRKSGSAA